MQIFKRALCFLMVLSLAILLTACSIVDSLTVNNDTSPPAIESISCYPEASITQQEINHVNEIIFYDTHYVLSSGDDFPVSIGLDFHYLQIKGVKDVAVEDAVNLMLFDLAFKSLGDGFSLAQVKEALDLASEHTSGQPSATDLVANTDFELLFYSPKYVSLRIFGDNTFAASRVNPFEYVVTIDLQNATYLELSSCVNMDNLMRNIDSGKFLVQAGNYEPGGWDMDIVKSQFSDALKTWMDTEQLKKAHANYSTRWDLGASRQTVLVQGISVDYQEYDIFTSQNFAFDTQSLLIRFPFKDSLNGYVILSIKCEDEGAVFTIPEDKETVHLKTRVKTRGRFFCLV